MGQLLSRTTAGRSRNLYTSSTILTACHHFIRRWRFYGELISLAVTKKGVMFSCKVSYLLPDFNQIWITRQIYMLSPQKSVRWQPRWQMRTDWQTALFCFTRKGRFYEDWMSSAIIKHISAFTWSGRYFCLILTKFEFFREIFIKVPNIRYEGNSSSGILRGKLTGGQREDRDGRAGGLADTTQ